MQYNYGIPAGFWHDEFVLGFMGFMISFHMRIASHDSLSQTEKGQALYEILTSLSNMNGKALAREFTKLSFEQTNDFKKGSDTAALITFYMIGCLKHESDNEHVKEDNWRNKLGWGMIAIQSRVY